MSACTYMQVLHMMCATCASNNHCLTRHLCCCSKLELLRCDRVGDQGLMAVARHCRQLTSVKLHNCPQVSATWACCWVSGCLLEALACSLIQPSRLLAVTTLCNTDVMRC